ncbi:hypothetical protein, partial [Vibrio cholerae]|uniref:hypothetical protein n=1 Tax=Vibrio cholerae TaxID=666 RepID=UPI001F246601
EADVNAVSILYASYSDKSLGVPTKSTQFSLYGFFMFFMGFKFSMMEPFLSFLLLYPPLKEKYIKIK